MTIETERVLVAAILATAAAAAGWAGVACRRARAGARPGADAHVWIAIALVFLALALARVAHLGPWLGDELRLRVRAAGLYGRRRPLQVLATISLAAFALISLAIGMRSILDALRRYRLAAGCAATVLASALIRFVSLHEVDAANAAWPWLRVLVDVGTSAAATAAALARVRQATRPALEPDRGAPRRAGGLPADGEDP